MRILMLQSMPHSCVIYLAGMRIHCSTLDIYEIGDTFKIYAMIRIRHKGHEN